MATCSFEEARRVVIERVTAARLLAGETVALENAAGRVLHENILADRDSPAAARSIRDGFAVRAADLPGSLEIIGEVRAGGAFSGVVGPGECVEIMTGALLPDGADAVVMVEHTTRDGSRMHTSKSPKTGEFVNPRASEATAGLPVLLAGQRLDFARIAMAASVGKTELPVFRQPRVAILSTGDEVIPVNETPGASQVRNSNAWSLAAQVRDAGGIPSILPVAPDLHDPTLDLIRQGLTHDLLLLSGGVSAGKYDLVETVLSELGAEFFFDRVLIQPGQPLVFGKALGRFFFGLPGNPASTMVTFQIFARAAVELLAGCSESMLPFLLTRLTTEFRHKPGLTRFLPALLSPDGAEVTPVPWQGSSDVPALARANAFLVADSSRDCWRAGDLIQVLVR